MQGSRPLSASTTNSSTLLTPDTHVCSIYLSHQLRVHRLTRNSGQASQRHLPITFVGNSPIIVAASPHSNSTHALSTIPDAGTGTIPWQPQPQHHPRHSFQFDDSQIGECKPVRPTSLPNVTPVRLLRQQQQRQPATDMPVNPTRNMIPPAPPAQASQQQEILRQCPPQDRWNAQLQQQSHILGTPNGGNSAGIIGDRYATPYPAYDEVNSAYAQATPYSTPEAEGVPSGGLRMQTGMGISSAGRGTGAGHYTAVASRLSR